MLRILAGYVEIKRYVHTMIFVIEQIHKISENVFLCVF